MESLGIIAKTIDNIHFTYECPFCWTKYKSNGEPSLRGKRTTHRHGSSGDLKNRIENRITHCIKNNSHVYIHITDATRRI